MEVEKSRKILEKSNRILGGANGIVYLMFVGRENYAAHVQGPMTDALFKHKSNVNQVIGKLVKEGPDFLIPKGTYRKEGARGRKREIYTANLDPIFTVLSSFGIEFDRHKLQLALESLSAANDFFPKFLINIFQVSIVRKLPWNGVLSSYFNYLSEVLRASKLLIFPMPSDFSVKPEKIEALLKTYPNLRKELVSISMQLTSPSLGFNPEFKAHVAEVLEKLDSKDSEMRAFLEFLQGLKKEGITDFSTLLSQVREGRTILKNMQEVKNKLTELEKQLKKKE